MRTQVAQSFYALSLQCMMTNCAPESVTMHTRAILDMAMHCFGETPEVPIHYCPNRFRSALAVDSSHVESLCNLGELLRCQDKTDEAESLLRHVIARFVLTLCRRKCMQ